MIGSRHRFIEHRAFWMEDGAFLIRDTAFLVDYNTLYVPDVCIHICGKRGPNNRI